MLQGRVRNVQNNIYQRKYHIYFWKFTIELLIVWINVKDSKRNNLPWYKGNMKIVCYPLTNSYFCFFLDAILNTEKIYFVKLGLTIFSNVNEECKDWFAIKHLNLFNNDFLSIFKSIKEIYIVSDSS